MTETLQTLHALHAEMRAQRLSQEHLTSLVLTALQRLKEPKKETLILGPGGFTYESEGYPFNALVVSDSLNGSDIEITERGQTYTYTLQAGWNVLNVSDGAYLTSATAISVMLVRDTRELFATFGTRVTVENASSNPVKTQLTSSNTANKTLLNAVTAAQTSPDVTVDGYKTFEFEVFGTATTCTLAIEGKSISGNAYTKQVFSEASNGMVTSITSSGLYQVDVTGLESIDANLTAVGNIADPNTALVLAASGSGSGLGAGTVYVLFTYENAFGETLVGSSQASITVTAGQYVTTSITLETGATGIGLYVGTASSASKFADVSSSGAITYSGAATTGLTVTVNGNTLNLSIGAGGNGGTSQPTTSTATGNITVQGKLVA